MNNKIKIIGITGGSGSGKSYLVEKLSQLYSSSEISIIPEDNYYKNYDDLPLDERAKQNFDHPDSKDFYLLIEQLKILKAGKPAEIPIYDFTRHLRSIETKTILPTNVIIIEGILLLSNIEVRNQIDLSVFVDTQDDIRLIRRIKRDIEQRGRTFESVIDQYLATVKPMYSKFIKPVKENVDLIIDGEWKDISTLAQLKEKIDNI